MDLLAERAACATPITVVIDGDFLELLQVERWLVDGTRPYNFVGEPDTRTVATAAAIARQILDDNAAVLAALARGHARFVVLYGNHDRLLRHPDLAPVRARLAKALGGEVRFGDDFSDERHRLVVRHGHELDWTASEFQYARRYDGVRSDDPERRMLAPIGDWVALEIGTRLGHLAGEMLGSGDPRWDDLAPPARHSLHARMSELHHVRPHSEILRWLISPAGIATADGEAEAISRFLGDLMNNLLTQAVPLVEPWMEAHDRPFADRLALRALELLGSIKYTASAVPRLMERIQSHLALNEHPWALLPHLPEWRDPRYRYFVGGHTHEATAQPLRDERWYLNTGTCRRTILRSPLDDGAYSALKELAFTVFLDEEEALRVTGRRDTCFELWQASVQRF